MFTYTYERQDIIQIALKRLQRLLYASRDQRAGSFLAQRISIAIQCGNAASLLGTLPMPIGEEEFYDT
jgi:hypothetical protein